MPLKTYKVDVPELNRTCITTVVEMPIDSEMYYNVPDNVIVVGVQISPVVNHNDMLSVAIILAKNEKASSDA